MAALPVASGFSRTMQVRLKADTTTISSQALKACATTGLPRRRYGVRDAV
jgi:hypothetical protein